MKPHLKLTTTVALTKADAHKILGNAYKYGHCMYCDAYMYDPHKKTCLIRKIETALEVKK